MEYFYIFGDVGDFGDVGESGRDGLHRRDKVSVRTASWRSGGNVGKLYQVFQLGRITI
jgi:hypothetical protein